MHQIEINNLTHRRGEQTVLREVSLTIDESEIVVIMGPSGSGKSSLLRCLNRLEDPPEGCIRLRGEDITALSVITLRQRVGMIFQKTAPFPGTVRENIAYGPGLRGETLSPERIKELVQLAALEPDLIDRPAGELSGGQEQRLAIARALANEPEVLLLDEPTSALDPVATHTIEATMRNLRDRLGLTLIWVSHSAAQARRVGDRLILLEAGRITREGQVAHLLDAESGDAHVLAFAAGEQSDSSR